MICVLNKQKKHGVLKFIGETKFSSGVWCGVELREPCGKNDGSVAGVRYFKCDDQHGIFVNPKNVFPTNDEQKSLQVPTKKDEKMSVKKHVEQESSDSSYEEERPRSKSDVVRNGKLDDSNLFCNSPFKYNIRNAKSSSSLSKLNNVTYVCSLPVFNATENTNVQEPTHSLPCSLSSSNKLCESIGKNEESSADDMSSELHHHTDLSPKFEVKQSIKLESMNTAKFPAPAALENDQDSKLNKTFLVRPGIRSLENKGERVYETSERLCDSKETPGNVNEKQETVIPSSNKTNGSGTIVSTSECDFENGRPRSSSKSSWSSMESLSSVGSVKSNTERSRLNGTKTPRKLPCPTECSKSKLVKISAEKKKTSKLLKGEAQSISQRKLVMKSASKPAGNDALVKKNRTKSTSVVAPRSTLVTPSVSKSAAKAKSKSVSSDVRDGDPLTRSRLNASKFATPLASKIPAAGSSRLTSTPICKKSVGLEKKSKISTSSSVRSRTLGSLSSSSTSLTGNTENEQRSISRENSNVENKVSSIQVKSKLTNSVMSAKKEKDRKADVSRSRNLSTSATSNKSLSSKTRTLSTSAASKSEIKPIVARGRNLSTSCSNKEEMKPAVSKLRGMSKTEGGTNKTSGQ